MEREHINLLQVVSKETPLFWVVVAAAGVIAAVEIALWVIARRWRRPAGATGDASPSGEASGWLAATAAAGPVVLGGLVVGAIQIGRASVSRGLAEPDPGGSIALISAGLGGAMNATMVGLGLLGPLVLLAAVPASLHASAALKVPGRSCLILSLAFVGAGLGPFLLGAWLYTGELTHIFAGAAGTDPAFKEMMVTQGIAETRPILDRLAFVGAAGLVGALIAAIVVVVTSDRRSDHEARRGRGGWIATAACLIVAAACYLAAEPLRAETALPWPHSPCAALTNNRLATPAVDGPDEIPRAEVLGVTGDSLMVGGLPRDPEGVRNTLVVLRNNYLLLHPADTVDESLVIVCPPDTPTSRLVLGLRFAQALEYRRPAFAFGTAFTIDRPWLGRLRRWRWTAAKALIPGIGPETPTPIVTVNVGDHPTCDGVARAVAAARRAGKIAGLAF